MGMTQSIRQPGQIFFQWIIRPGKQVPQIMGEHLVWLHSRAFTKSFHIPPDIGAVKGLSRPRHEHRSVGDLLLFQVFFSSPHSFPGRKTVRRFPLLSTAHFLAAGQRPQTNIPSAGHLSAFVAEKGALYFQRPDRQLWPVHKVKGSVDRCRHGIDGSWSIGICQMFFPCDHSPFCDRLTTQKRHEAVKITPK